MRELGFGCVLLGIALLGWPLYGQLLDFVHLASHHAQLAGGALLVMGGTTMALTTR